MLESLFATLLPSAGHAYSTNSVPERSGNRHVADSYVPFDTFPTSDGWVAVVCATDQHWANLTQALDRPDLAADESLQQLAGRIARIDEISALVAEWTSSRPRDEVTARLQEFRVPAAPLRDVLEILSDPHLHGRGFLTDVDVDGKWIALPNSPLRYHGSALRSLTPPPELGEHTDSVLRELCGLDDSELAALHRDGVVGS